jgi:hypothetical protein
MKPEKGKTYAGELVENRQALSKQSAGVPSSNVCGITDG